MQVKRHENKHIHLAPVYTVFSCDPEEKSPLVPPGAAQLDDVLIVLERGVCDLHVVMQDNKTGLGESSFVREWAIQLGHGECLAAVGKSPRQLHSSECVTQPYASCTDEE